MDAINTIILKPKEVLDERVINRSSRLIDQFLIQWDDLPSTTTTWEARDHIVKCFPDWNHDDKALLELKGIVMIKPHEELPTILVNSGADQSKHRNQA